MDSLDPYVYVPLCPGEIRLFSLHPSKEQSCALVGELQIVKFKSDEDSSRIQECFHALSYTWGDQTTTFSLTCSGREIRIHKSLRDALIRLRVIIKSPCLPLWIDAICINQYDEAEKISQINLMADIYSIACKTWIWLGEEMEGSAEAVAVMPRLIEAIPAIKQRIDTEDYTDPEIFHLPNASSPVWPAFLSITTSPWFTRLWVLQEFALAHEVEFICGGNCIEWKTLRQVLDFEVLYQIIGSEDFREAIPDSSLIIKARELSREFAAVPHRTADAYTSLTAAMYFLSRDQICSDPKDRVFALLGFLQKKQRDELHFNTTTTLEELYIQFCHLLLGALDDTSKRTVLSDASFGCSKLNLPSWCPDFHHLTKGPTFGHSIQYRASTKKYRVQKCTDASRLIITGAAIDKVATVVPGSWTDLPDNDTPEKYRKQAQSNLAWLETCYRVSVLPMSGNDGAENCTVPSDAALDAVWRTLIADQHHTPQLTSLDYLQVLKHVSGMAKAETLLLLNDSNIAYIYFLKKWQESRKYFRTRDGRVGLAPTTVQTNDIVCIFHGSHVPHIIRPGGQQGTWVIIGEAYVHGMMYGEAEQLSPPAEDFILM